MSTQMVFERYEKKYLLDPDALQQVKKAMDGRMQLDRYGKTTISNLYFDTPDYRIIRASLDAKVYKEKLRVRSYKQIGSDEDVFVELKKKYNGIVYKRRIAIPEFQAMDWLCAGGTFSGEEDDPLGLVREKQCFNEQPNFRQIGREIDCFLRRFESKDLAPRVFLSYEREAYAPIRPEAQDRRIPTPGNDIRITFDSNIRARTHDLSLRASAYGEPVLDKGLTVMEVKIPKDGAMPLWLVHCMSHSHITHSSFSKYGHYYKEIICKDTGPARSAEPERKTYPLNEGGLLYA